MWAGLWAGAVQGCLRALGRAGLVRARLCQGPAPQGSRGFEPRHVYENQATTNECLILDGGLIKDFEPEPG